MPWYAAKIHYLSMDPIRYAYLFLAIPAIILKTTHFCLNYQLIFLQILNIKHNLMNILFI